MSRWPILRDVTIGVSSGVPTVATNAGMLALWRTSAFADVDGHDAWEARVNDRLGDAIRRGELVPVGIQADGAFGVRVVVEPDGPSERELRYAVLTSEPYLLVADGSEVCMGGLEHVGDRTASPLTISLPEGRYSVRAMLVAWDEEPDAIGPDGLPTPDALPDFLVMVGRAGGHEAFRVARHTFDPPT